MFSVQILSAANIQIEDILLRPYLIDKKSYDV